MRPDSAHTRCSSVFFNTSPIMHLTVNDEQALVNAGIRVTAVRLLIWRTVRHTLTGAFAVTDVEAALPTVDRSTVFRTLNTLVDGHLLHLIDDGTTTQKYCVCHLDDTRHCVGHVHLNCLRCHRTMCLTRVPIPPVPLPQGFVQTEAEYIVKGLCPDCAAQRPI